MTVAKRKIVLSALLGIVSAGVIATTGYAAQEPVWIQKMSRPVLHQALAKAIESDDYNAFAGALKGRSGTQSVTQAQFDALVAVYQLHKAGKDTQAQILLHHAGI